MLFPGRVFIFRVLLKEPRIMFIMGQVWTQTPGYRAVTAIPPASALLTDMRYYEELFCMLIQGNDLYRVKSLSPLPARSAGALLSILHSNHPIHTLYDSIQNPHLQQFILVLFSNAVLYSFQRNWQLVDIQSILSAPLCLECAAARASSRSEQG